MKKNIPTLFILLLSFHFALAQKNAKVIFKRGSNNQIEKLVLYQNGSELEGKKLN